MTSRAAHLDAIPRQVVRRRGVHRLLFAAVGVTLLLASTLLNAVAAGSGPYNIETGASYSMEDDFLRLLNNSRSANGLKPLTRVDGVDNVAREWTETMAIAQKLYHRPGLSTPFTGNWRSLGENVGIGYAAESLHQAFMDSPGHRANIMGDYDYVGIGVGLASSRVWVTFNFVKGDPATASKYRTDPLEGQYATGSGTDGPYYDIGDTVHRQAIIDLDDRGLLISCADGRYCPDEPMRRSEMAVFLVRAFRLKPATERFTDVSSSHPYAAEIGALAAAGVTLGCNPPANDRFCPENTVTRQQMASFFTRALELRTQLPPFRDVRSDNVHKLDIGALADSGITRGCNPPSNSNYCPTDPVTRGQMASFIKRALG